MVVTLGDAMIMQKKFKRSEVLKAVLYYVVNTELPEDKEFDVSASFTEDDEFVEVMIKEIESIKEPLVLN